MLFPLYSNDGVVLRGVNELGRKGLDHIKNMTLIKLPCLCGAGKDKVISEKDRYALDLQFKMCRHCGAVRIDPYFKEEDLSYIYSYLYRDIKSKTAQETYEYQLSKGQEILRLLTQEGQLNRIKKVLEIGTGCGGILDVFKKAGREVVGLDFDKSYIQYGKAKGLNLLEGDALEYLARGGGKGVDLVILNHVLEHIKSPKDFLEKVFRNLEQDTLIYISIPGLLKFPNEQSPNNLAKCFAFVHPWWFDLNSLKLNVFRELPLEVVYEDESIKTLVRKSNTSFKWQNHPQKVKVLANFVYLKIREKILREFLEKKLKARWLHKGKYKNEKNCLHPKQ